MAEKVLTAKQLAERYDVAYSTARGWCLSGIVPGARLEQTALGSYWVVPEKNLAGFVPPRRGPKPKKGRKK